MLHQALQPLPHVRLAEGVVEKGLAPGERENEVGFKYCLVFFCWLWCYLHLLVPASVVLVWLVVGIAMPLSSQEMEGAGLENLVTHSTC